MTLIESSSARLLIVDDNIDNRELLKLFLKKTSYELTECEEGKSAVEQMQAEAFDLILMDIRMPIMDGIEATKSIRAFNEMVPILFCTANDDEKTRAQALKVGGNEFLRKPIHKQELIEQIERHLKAYFEAKQNLN